MPIRLIVAISFFLVSAPRPSDVRAATTWPAAEWTRSAPEAQGMDSARLAAMLERIQNDNPGIRSVTVIRHGAAVLDARIAPFASGDRHDIHSCTKSVLSALVGIAIQRGELSGLDVKVLDYFPDYETARLDDDKRALTMRHLLMMSAGLKTEDSYLYDWVGLNKMHQSPDWARYVLDLPVVAKPGTRFEYSNGVSHLIAVILQNATGQSLEAYAREHLFGPIGITDFSWETFGQGQNLGYSGLSLYPLDMARLGYLYLHGGEWDGVPVVPAEWVKDSTSPQITAGTLAQSYGYQWWVDTDMFMMQGYGGQFVYVLPKRDMVVVFTSALPSRLFFTPWTLLNKFIETASISDNPLPANPSAAAHLEDLAKSLGRGATQPLQPAPALAQTVSGRKFEFASNSMRLRSLTLHFPTGSPEATIEFVVGPMGGSLPVGLDGTFRVADLFGQRWACRGHWENGETFTVEQEAPSKVLRRRITFSFQGDTMSFEVNDRITGSVENFSAKMAETESSAR